MESKLASLLSAITAYDRAQSKRQSYNHYALGHYAKALGNIRQRLALGQELRDAIITEFVGRLCDRLLRAVDLPVMTDQEARGLAIKLPDLPDDE